MDVYLCPSCVPVAIWPIYQESDITNKRLAPWGPGGLESLRAYQRSVEYLPFVCDSHHILQSTTEAMICRQCPNFVLAWAYTWALDWTWKTDLGYGGAGGEPNAPVPRKPKHPDDSGELAAEKPSPPSER